MMTKTIKAGELKTGDSVVDRDGLEVRVTVLGQTAATITVTLDYVEKAMFACPPAPKPKRLSKRSLVTVVTSQALAVDYAGGVAKVNGGVGVWYAPAAEARAALAAACDGEEGAYDEFCRLCPSGLFAEDHDAAPMMARYADAKFDLATEDGREEALLQVFLSDSDRMADAMMWLDAQQEGVVLP